jgi:hypothetical protein
MKFINALNFFYLIKPVIPRRLQIVLRQKMASYKKWKHSDVWPINHDCAQPPKNWKGWPNNKKFLLILSHDVDTQKGHDNALKLLEIEKKLNFKSSFNFVPERYNVNLNIIEQIKNEGFGIGLHGLRHDGKLFSSKKIFDERSKRINSYLKVWGTKGFTAPSMISKLDWMHILKIDYSTSTFDTDPIEPQPFNSMCKIFPFIVKSKDLKNSFVELPYTLPQDFTLYILLQQKTCNIWKNKLDWIYDRNGMALLNTHPDYINFTEKPNKYEEYSIDIYINFLNYIKNKYKDKYWNPLTEQAAKYFRESI